MPSSKIPSTTIPKQLRPNRQLITIESDGIRVLEPQTISALEVGQKAYGLLLLPSPWTLPFFVIKADALSLSPDKLKFFLELGADKAGVVQARILVRSNGTHEGLRERGKLWSEVADWNDASQTLFDLSNRIEGIDKAATHWILQAEETVHLKGQLSNERRLRYEKRDWVIETEVNGDELRSKQTSIAVRRWRDGIQADTSSLRCDSALKVSLALKKVAMWAGQDHRRFLFEWLWNGQEVKIVQMDAADDARGVVPSSLLPDAIPQTTGAQLAVFREAQSEDYLAYRKLGNAALYRNLGYEMPPFYVFDNQSLLDSMLQRGIVPPEVESDLKQLAIRPLVLRTDGTGIPPNKREMLPRSEELRNGVAACRWISEDFRRSVEQLDLGKDGLCLIGHHFLPAVASAWAGAVPGKRWVRVEALWGIPESLYWYPHDTFEIDTEKVDLSRSYAGKTYPVRSRQRFKGMFIAPDAAGAWVMQETAPPDDWNPTIKSMKHLSEIAHTTRRICERVGKPVQVMWFVGVHKDASRHSVLPWYHSTESEEGVPSSAPRKKVKTSQERYIRNQADWKKLESAVSAGERVERIIVEPSDPEIIRNQDFAASLGALAQRHRIVVVLAGGILSHAYHALRRSGAAVECIDLYGASEERTEFNKVVRDKVPSQIADRGEHFEVVRLSGDALNVALRRKLVEEALEALDAKDGTEILAELADVVEVVRALTRAMQVTEEQLQEERVRKERTKGAFDDSMMLLRTASPFSISQSARLTEPERNLAAEAPKVIDDPAGLPHKPLYKRPDRRATGGTSEELLVIEIELNRLGSVTESSSFELPPNIDSRKYVSTIELSREQGNLRAAIRLTPKLNSSADEPQLQLPFGDVESAF